MNYITGKLVRAGSFAWSDNPANDAMAYALVATERDTLKRVKSLPMHEEVAIIRNETHRIQTERIEELERKNAKLLMALTEIKEVLIPNDLHKAWYTLNRIHLIAHVATAKAL